MRRVIGALPLFVADEHRRKSRPHQSLVSTISISAHATVPARGIMETTEIAILLIA
jgi:hypothetical protein